MTSLGGVDGRSRRRHRGSGAPTPEEEESSTTMAATAARAVGFLVALPLRRGRAPGRQTSSSSSFLVGDGPRAHQLV